MILSRSANSISSLGDVTDLVEMQICYMTFHRTITAPVRIQEACTKNLEGLLGKGKIGAFDTDVTRDRKPAVTE